MRLKLILIASLLAALVGSGASIAIVLGVFTSLKPLNTPGLLVLSTFVLPAGAIVWATMFVYRHTARRRKLQAVMTALLGLLLALGTFTAAVVLTSRAGARSSATNSAAAKCRLINFRCPTAYFIEANPLLYRSQGVDNKTNVLVRVHA